MVRPVQTSQVFGGSEAVLGEEVEQVDTARVKCGGEVVEVGSGDACAHGVRVLSASGWCPLVAGVALLWLGGCVCQDGQTVASLICVGVALWRGIEALF